jgi:ADP-ribose pyrophosphatase
MKQGWQKKAVRPLYSNPPWCSVEGWTFARPDGSDNEYSISVQNEIVMVFAMTTDGQVMMVKQYFFVHDEMAWSLVAGFVDDGDTPLEAAKKELLEEAGSTAEEFVYLGSGLRSKYMTGECHMYLALGVQCVGKQELDPSEDIEVHLMSVDECKALLSDYNVREVYPEVCAYRALSYLKLL